jgi:hypothetical protein
VIYNEPGHRFYGPVRRLHLKIMELFGDDLNEVETAYARGIGKDWSHVSASALASGVSEAHNARCTIKTLLHLHDTIECQRRADEVAIFKGPCRS